MEKRTNCPMCNTEIFSYPNYDKNTIFYSCPICGRYELDVFHKINHNHLAAYLAHNCFSHEMLEYRYHTTLDKIFCNEYTGDFNKKTRTHSLPVHVDADIVETWFPKTFSERIDYILLFLENKIQHVGQQVSFSYNTLLSAMFVDRKEYNLAPAYNVGSWVLRKNEDCEHELQYMLDYLSKCGYIEYADGPSRERWVDLSIAPDGYSRIDLLQKNASHGRNVLVAMKFGDDTKNLREAIRTGIKDARFNPIFIDEVQHNDFITPELLKHIRDSRFVVVDLTHKNNGAYFEEGYAMGLGKPVIQLCQEDTHLHFDIAQKNTIMWATESEIPERLTTRIKATID